MKVAITSTGTDLDAQVDPRFGRCAHFILFDTDTEEFEAVANDNILAAGGAGIQSAQFVADKGAEVVLTGNCGPKAYRTLSAAGVEVIIGVSGAARDAIAKYRAGELSSTDAPNVDAKFGV